MTESTKIEYPTEEQICAIYGHQIIWKIRPDFRQRWERNIADPPHPKAQD